jgi:hypothetical protein
MATAGAAPSTTAALATAHAMASIAANDLILMTALSRRIFRYSSLGQTLIIE